MTLLLLPDIFVILMTITLVLILIDRTTGRALIHLDTLRTLASKVGFDLVSVWKSSQQAEIEIDRLKTLADWEEQTLNKIDTETAIKLIRDNRQEMRQLEQ